MRGRVAPAHWRRRGTTAWLLAPLACLFGSVSGLRRAAYRAGLARVVAPARPLIVVGNIAVGGSGKTPVVMWLAKRLRQAGYRPGIVSRGYGGSFAGVAEVCVDGTPEQFGDEPVMIARETGCPVFVGRDRPAAVQALLEAYPECTVLISDDGLQHYALGRSFELVVVDEAVIGNRMLIPAGPLREPLRRLCEVDMAVVQGDPSALIREALAGTPAFAMRLLPGAVRRLDGKATAALEAWRGRPVHAVAGIGRPERFFETLRACGLQVRAHAFGDHHRFRAEDLVFSPTAPILMTSKDAVKCRSLAPSDAWEVPVTAEIEAGAFEILLEKLAHGQSLA